MSIRDLKLRSWLKAFEGVQSEVPTLATSELRKVAEAYNRNVSRVNRLVMFPPASILVAIKFQRATDSVHNHFRNATQAQRSDLINRESKTKIRRYIHFRF